MREIFHSSPPCLRSAEFKLFTCWESESVCNLQVCALFVRQLKLMTPINCVQSEIVQTLYIAFLYTRARFGNALSLVFIFSQSVPNA